MGNPPLRRDHCVPDDDNPLSGQPAAYPSLPFLTLCATQSNQAFTPVATRQTFVNQFTGVSSSSQQPVNFFTRM